MFRIPNSFVRHVVEPAWDIYENSVRLKTLKHLDQTQFFSPEKIKRVQLERLRKIIRHAADSCDFYKGRFSAAGIDYRDLNDISDLANVPPLTKNEVRECQASLVSNKYPQSSLIQAKTGGSTGIALRVFCDENGVQMRNGAAMRAYQWSGWRIGQPIGAVWGNPVLPHNWKSKLRSWVKNRFIYLNTMKVDDAAMNRFFQEWQIMKPGMLYGHAHSLYVLAEYLQKKNLSLNPKGIVSTSMMLLNQERNIIEDVCGIKVTDLYGCEEVGLIASECEAHCGMHINAEQNIVEFLRDDGRSCQPGQEGRIVVTDLVNYGMPLIRYEVGDRGTPSASGCSCGRGLPMMESLSGRTADFLIAQNGAKVAGISIIENTLTKFPGIKQLQIVQESRLFLKVNFVPGDQIPEETQTRLANALRAILGGGFEIEFNIVDNIPQEPSGKYRFTRCLIMD